MGVVGRGAKCAAERRVGRTARSRIPLGGTGLFRAASLRTRCAPFRCAGLSSDLCRVRDGVIAAALAENAQYHCGFLHFACLLAWCYSSPVPLRPVDRLSRSPDWPDVTPATNAGTPSP